MHMPPHFNGFRRVSVQRPTQMGQIMPANLPEGRLNLIDGSCQIGTNAGIVQAGITTNIVEDFISPQSNSFTRA